MNEISEINIRQVVFIRYKWLFLLCLSPRQISSAAPISGPFNALIDDGITFNASIKKNKIWDAEKGLTSSMFPIKSNKRGSDFP